MYKFIGKIGRMYDIYILDNIKLNYRCEFNGNDYKCDDSSPSKTKDSFYSLANKWESLSGSNNFDIDSAKSLVKQFDTLSKSKSLDDKYRKKATRFINVINNVISKNMAVPEKPNNNVNVLISHKKESIKNTPKSLGKSIPSLLPFNEKVLMNNQKLSLNENEKNILYQYSMPDNDELELSFDYINKFANNIKKAPEMTIKAIKTIDKIMDTTSLPAGKVYRGVSNKEAESLLANKFSHNGYLSTTIDKNIANDFTNDSFNGKYIIEIDIPEKSRGIFMTSDLSDTSHEKELVLDKKYKLVPGSTSFDKETGKTIIHARLV